MVHALVAITRSFVWCAKILCSAGDDQTATFFTFYFGLFFILLVDVDVGVIVVAAFAVGTAAVVLVVVALVAHCFSKHIV